MKATSKRLFFCFVAVWVAHVAWLFQTVDSGPLRRFDPAFSAIIAAVVTFASFVLGQTFRFSAIRSRWEKTGGWAVFVVALGIAALVADNLFGRMRNLWVPGLAPFGLILIGFGVACFPKTGRTNQQSSTAHRP